VATTNGDSQGEPSDKDKSLYENHRSKPMGTTTYKYYLKLDYLIPSSNLSSLHSLEVNV
jgi:hypothetical protein